MNRDEARADTPKRVFVAGATGVLGWRAVRALVVAGHEVTGIARTDEKAALLRSLGATPVRVDLFDEGAVRDVAAGYEAVLNLATHVPPPAEATRRSAWAEHERIRSEGARILVDAALAGGATVYVQESLAFAYEDGGDRWLDEDTPLMAGGAATAVRAGEAETARFTAAGGGRRGVALRFGQFYAPDSTHTEALVRLARRGMSMHVGGADGYAPAISCDDAAAAVVAALDAPAGVYNVVDDEPMTRRQLDAVMVAAVGGRKLVRPPEAALKVGGDDAAIFRLSNRASNARFKQATGWAPRYPSARAGYAALAAAVPGRRTSLVQTVILAFLGISALGLGLYATFTPRAFYDDFPNGRAWVALDGPYNEHLVRDFGALQLALGFFTLVAAFVGGRAIVRAAAGANLLFAVPHLVFHVRHLDHYEGFDKAANVVSLSAVVVLTIAVLALERRSVGSADGSGDEARAGHALALR
jgi:nucleoside-diphosphate-sugar epimerase